MGILSVLTGIISQVAPKAIEVAGYAIQGVIDGISKNKLAGYRLDLDDSSSALAGIPANPQGFKISGLDPIISPEDAQSEQILNRFSGVSTNEVIKGILLEKAVETATLIPSLINCKTEDVVLEAAPSFYYYKLAEPNETKDGVPVIGSQDHAYTHLIPKLFRNYNKLLEYYAFRLDRIEITSSQATTDVTATTVSFFPFCINTTDYDNTSIKNSCNKTDSGAYGSIKYVLRNFSPNVYKKIYSNDDKFNFVTDDMTVHPNGAILTSFLEDHDGTDKDDEFFSYGTVCMVKENLGEGYVAMQFSIKMYFTCWSMFTTKPYTIEESDGDDDGSGSGSGSGSTRGRGGRCILNKKNNKKIPDRQQSDIKQEIIKPENNTENLNDDIDDSQISSNPSSFKRKTKLGKK